MTVQEFYQWESGDETGRRWQLVDGVPKMRSVAPVVHGRLHAEVGALIGNHLHATGSSFRVLSSVGIVPRVYADHNFRIADLAVTGRSPSFDFAIRDPVLLVEILSEYDQAETWSNIWTYSTVPTVTEIVIVHCTRMEVELLRRDAEGNWPAAPAVLRPPDTLVLSSIGFALPVAAAYRTAPLG